MAYCTSSDIASEFRDITFSSTTAVTTTDVSAFCDQASALIDSYVANKYAVPVTGTASLLLMKMIAVWLVKSRIISIISVKAPVDKARQDPDSQKLYDQALALLNQIKKGTLQLTDATLVSSADGLTSYLMNETIEHQFEMESDAW